ncbi:ATP-binding protein [Ponticoccus sp. SC2-23]|uniref:AAA family ATPase n=1 Tax=Alexandriicola marinus TaxID=2081710 RepID=UPI000FDA6877|nr:ATP-binding protein [Alexandriicola marinus]MBM1222215.1 ATP-binding protein [Ponticoccus sp. SC6-9]MBM1226902.1 ATP-binding protein [Ponticoccus sp. SC6-15]MBM1231162.1 ATP-binding protein [Ponticoccus sp. SC6-38]MBM1235586.1 ATP-binding protein [Ponticoccus sp. SC6-45]MBM1240184.1 ATP-binding protein [Ponticoccus sp. SC6-49]MBM1244538.1 ATP-binding protein [Ponticoccus sp. SC2-64]MBM1249060.1 ATP-binding protein [Ponticoccus sp. SC6-42]MBM1253839.1 ATP-binding protein [Ponticoccus sp. 
MAVEPAVLHCLCGKPAAGKSTLCAELSRDAGTIALSEDVWLDALYGEEMSTLSDFVRCSDKLRYAVGPHVVALLERGLSVILDFHANTVEARLWMRRLADAAGVECKLHYLDVPDDLCRIRLAARRARGDHPFNVTPAQFDGVVAHFVPPTEAEGITIIRHAPPETL